MTTIDTGARCDRHLDEIFPVRCYDCGTATPEAHASPAHAPVDQDGMCTLHHFYPAPCARCQRDAQHDQEN